MIWRYLPAKGRGHGGAGDAGHLVADGELAEVAQLRFAQALALEGDQAHRQAGGVELHHDGRQRAGGQVAQAGHGEVGDAGHVRIGIRAGLEIHLDEAHAVQRAGLHVIHPRSKREHALKLAGDVVFNLLRRHPGIKRRHDHHGNVDRRKQIHRHPDQAGHPHHTGDEADDDDEIRKADGESRHGD